MLPRPADRGDIPTIRELAAELPNPPYLPLDDNVAAFWEGDGNVAFVGVDDDGKLTGEFAHAHWSEVHQNTMLIHLLPEGMSMGRLAPIALAALNAISARYPQSRNLPAGGIFARGFDPVTSEGDYGLSKANAWANFTQGQAGERLAVTEAYDDDGNRKGTAAMMPLVLLLSGLRRALMARPAGDS